MKQDAARSAQLRRRFLLTGIVGAAVFMTARAVQLQLVHADEWQARAARQHAKQSTLPAARGAIYDRDGIPLAASNEAFRINIAPREVKNRPQLAEKLAQLTQLDEQTVAHVLDPHRSWVVLPGDYSSAVREALDHTTGVYFDRVLRRFYPHGDVALDILGTVNVAGQPQGGIELEYDSVLSGKAGFATPHGYDTIVGERGVTISGAQFQARCSRRSSRLRAAISI